MKKTALLVLSIVLTALFGCAPSLRTERLALPSSSGRGPFTVVVTPSKDIKPSDVVRFKKLTADTLSAAGFGPVDIDDSRGSVGRAVEVTLTAYEHSYPAKNEGIFAGVGCVYICPLFAPCLLLPGYYEPQFEITAEVSGYRNGQRLFKKALSERAKSSANLINTGDDDFKASIESLTIHNFTVAVLKNFDKSFPEGR
jgi:hypothetical protein